ncbi:MerR family transcriptional regulator [Rheinheimera sp. F8]|uniref:MerR family transcriptional regulator n=1 Tax=Rheinheimera sp. F8 TaxID=1763998 RepID=UPI000744B5EE|nr:MerR family transcriptional regulator [Rheinheimera sp. F8]ALZ74891.1 MerR family transcriptional regulator [Rheinheimera sp. F8]
MKIADVSQQTGLSTYTIRYYEKQGLVAKANKDSSGHRSYSGKDVDLLNWVSCLKKSGMSLNKIRVYSLAYQQGDQAQARLILQQHLQKLLLQQQDIVHHITVTEAKIRQLGA